MWGRGMGLGRTVRGLFGGQLAAARTRALSEFVAEMSEHVGVGPIRQSWVVDGYHAMQPQKGWPALSRPELIDGLSALGCKAFAAIELPNVSPEPSGPAAKSEPRTVDAASTVSRPRANADRFKQYQCLADLQRLHASGTPIPSQEWLRERWGLSSKSTVSKWLRGWERERLIPTMTVSGRCKILPVNRSVMEAA